MLFVVLKVFRNTDTLWQSYSSSISIVLSKVLVLTF